MKFCVIGGAGHIGSKAVRILKERESDATIIIADKNLEKAEKIAEELGEKVKTQKVDATSLDSLTKVIEKVDVAISTLGPFHKFGSKVLKAAIEAGTDFIDVDDDYDATIDCLELHEEAKDAGITAIIGLGATPGLTNIWAKYGAEKLDDVKEIHTSWAWTAIDPDMGPGITDHYFHAITGEVPTFKNGELVEVPALSESESIEFPSPLGEFEPANAGHPEPVTIPLYIEGVQTVTNKGIVWPGSLNEAAELFAELGLTSQKEILVRGESVPVREIMVQIIMALEDIAPEETIGKAMSEIEEYDDYAMRGVGLKTVVTGKLDGESEEYEYASSCEDARVATALPAVIGAQLLVEEDHEKSGVFAPEGILDPETFLRKIDGEIEIMKGVKERLEL